MPHLDPGDLIQRPRAQPNTQPRRTHHPHRIGTPQAIWAWALGQTTTWYSADELQ